LERHLELDGTGWNSAWFFDLFPWDLMGFLGIFQDWFMIHDLRVIYYVFLMELDLMGFIGFFVGFIGFFMVINMN
jgi:hypothetical protein